MVHKLNSQQGETLVEVLASILIASLSVALLFTCVMASVQIDRSAQKADEAYYKALSIAETQDSTDTDYPTSSGKVTIKNGSATKELDITLYGGEGVYAYAKKVAGP